jgi:AbrB family looped-hinge helix DNA binding protein
MRSFVAQVSAKFQVVIPKEVREKLNLEPHDAVIFFVDGDEVFLRPRPKDFVAALRGLHKELWPPDVDKWLNQERESWE